MNNANHMANYVISYGDQMTKFKVVCGWCKKVMAEGDPGAPVSHSICDACDEKLQQEENADESE